MMAVKFRLEALKKNDIIDVSNFTEMETEHGHDTASVITKRHGVHTDFS